MEHYSKTLPYRQDFFQTQITEGSLFLGYKTQVNNSLYGINSSLTKLKYKHAYSRLFSHTATAAHMLLI